jgi:DNA topoisomerase-1
MVVERERARMRFRSATWWGIDGTFSREATANAFGAALVALGGTAVATGKDFDEQGVQIAKSAVRILGEEEATSVAEALTGQSFTVKSVTERPFRRSPAAPFMTSTLQQEAGRKLRFSAQRAMQVAQRLYEQGYITYMRTDSTTLSDEALSAARSQARERYGDTYVPDAPRRYERKVKNAQEAHEAIRPSGETFRTPEQVGRELSGDELRLYEMIWMRTVASQMNDATGTSAQVRLVADVPSGVAAGQEAEFSASGRVISFKGFLEVYEEGRDDDEPEAESAEERVLPALAEGDRVQGTAFEPGSHATQPPARYTEASLVKAMEELGVGRPSTYASVIATILDRGYVWKKGTALVPSFTAFAVVGLLERYFTNLVDYGFTASMEDDLDEIAAGTEEALPWLTRFYFGSEAPGAMASDGTEVDTLGLKATVAAHLAEIDAREINSIPLGEGTDGEQIVARVGRYGPYLQRGENRASIPDDLAPDELTIERAEEILAAPSNDRVLGTDPESGLEVQVKAGRFGPYVQMGAVVDGGEKPRTASLFSSMDPATLTFEQALELLRIPRTVGTDPETGEAVVAHNGRFGPYLKRGSDTRSLGSEEQLLTVTLDEAKALFAQPKQRRGRAAPPPLRELGTDPSTNLPVVVKEGRFGPYVTDGTTNASLRKGDTVEAIDMDRASELLAERRAAGPSTRKKKAAKKKAPAKKKAAAKKAPAKKTTGAKKAAVKKASAASKPAVDADGADSAAMRADSTEPF